MGSVRYREDVILPLVAGRRVLDCGGVDHDAAESKQASDDWLHARIAATAASVIGVDILEERVARINAEGRYTFVAANVEDLPYEGEFDVLVAGDIVEHLYNMGRFLDSAWKALVPGGHLVITTPNATALSGVMYAAMRDRELCHPEHTCYYSQQTLRYIVERHGFETEALHLVSRPAASPLVERLRNLAIRLRPLLAEKVVLVARRLEDQAKYADKW